jgi:hypothetical protein
VARVPPAAGGTCNAFQSAGRSGVVNASEQPDAIQRYLKAIQEKCRTVTSFFVSVRTRTYFFDKHRRIVLAGRGFDSGPGALNTIDRLPRSKDGLDEKAHGSFTYRSHGQFIHANIRFIEELDWYLVVDQTELETVRPILNTLLINLCVCVAITGVVLMLINYSVNYSVNAYQKRIETLRGIVPICSFCKQIRDAKGYWNKVEAYVAKHTDAQFSHSICPTCMQTHYPEEAAAIEKKKRTR